MIPVISSYSLTDSLNISSIVTTITLPLLICVLVGAFILFKIVTLIYRCYLFNKLPHDSQSHWLLGDIYRLMPTFPFTPKPDETPLRDAVNYYQDKFKDKSLFVVWLSWFPVVICKDYRSAQLFLGNKANLEKGWFYDFLDPRFKNGLIGSKIEKWSKRRRMILPALNRRCLENFVPIVVNSCQQLINDLHSTSGLPIDIKDPIYLVTFNIICQLVLGCQVLPGSQSGSSSSSANHQSASSPLSIDLASLIEAIASFTKPIMSRVVNPLFRFDWLFHCTPLGKTYLHHVNVFNTFSSQVIKNRLCTIQSTRLNHQRYHKSTSTLSDLEKNVSQLEYNSVKKSNNSTAKSLLDHLLAIYLDGKESQSLPDHNTSQSASTSYYYKLRSGAKIDLKGIKEEMDNSLAAGYETTAIAIMWIIYLLGLYPQIQRKAYESLNSIDLDNLNSLTLDQINGLTYLDQCVKEGIRLIPPLPMIARQLDSDVTYEGIKIPKGSTVGIMIHMIHRDETIYAKPDQYDPDRFDPTTGQSNIPTYGFIPFSMGPRNCVGQKFAYLEIKLVLACILKHFTLTSTQPLESVTYEYEMITSPKVPLYVQFNPR